MTRNSDYLHFVFLFALIYLVVFLKLDSFHIRWWDESMFAVNAYEMIENGKYFSPHFDGLPDNFNTKPPLSIWLQIIFIKLLGYNELAVRLPSAVAAALSILLTFNFVRRYNIWWAWLSVMVLLTSWGFIHFHTARTADADSLLTFFLLCANLSFIRFIYDDKKGGIFYFMIFLSLAFITKMFAAFLFVPAYLFILTKEKSGKLPY